MKEMEKRRADVFKFSVLWRKITKKPLINDLRECIYDLLAFKGYFVDQ